VALPPFQAFFDTHRDEVFRFLVGMVGREDAEDCFQETFMAALRAYPELRPHSNLRSWVLTIARRKAIDARRARGRRPVPVEDPPEPAVPGPDGQADHTALWHAVLGLPAKQRAAVLLRFAVDLPHRDVARVLGCSEEAARRSTHEGLRKLREVPL
jgi:RNA polymerase sigma factor (sigma-70 family)